MRFQLRFGVFLAVLSATAGLLLTLPFSHLTVTAAPPLSGAIFTTNANGTQVNGNIYQDKCDVYLDGGPGPNAPQHAAGLPDGDYYFQVTDPSGKTLLSTDPVVNRQFNVSGGIITGNSGLGNHVTGVDVDHGAATIQLCPFLDTPNPGGVYKVWVTPVADFVGDPNLVDDPCGHGCFHGFVPAATKTDNFKVKPGIVGCIQVTKFIDNDGDGNRDLQAGDTAYSGWPITIYGPLGNQVQGQLFTPVQVFNLEPGTYRVVEADNPGNGVTYIVTHNSVAEVPINNPDTEILVRIRKNDLLKGVLFGNQPQ
jgi:hypothetical protein